ncbi:MAG: efflux RND transporter periplasmic adaptor subunit, partial [Burkholderiales bacterium]
MQTEPLRRQAIAETLTGFGTVSPDVGGSVALTLPRAGQIGAVLVAPGQISRAGTVLLQFDTGAAATLAYRQAASALTFARNEVQRNEELLSQRLATQSQLGAARKALADAESALEAQRRLGSGRPREAIRAPFDGVIESIAVAQGDRVAAGAPLLRIARLSGMRVQLGIEPADSFRVRAGMAVRLQSVFDAARVVDTKVSAVHGMVNPQTQLVDVVARFRSAALIPGMRVAGVITVSSPLSWVVPRSAVLRDARGAFVFQVKDGHARRVDVKTGIESEGLVGVDGALD